MANSLQLMRNGVTSKRNVNFEILRSLCMLFIVMFHYLKSVGGVLTFDISTYPGLFNYIISTLLFILFSISVPCFVMITGFFLIRKTDFNIKRIERTWLKAFFFVVIIYGTAYLYDSNVKHLKDIFSVLYMGFRESVSLWFVDYYLGLIFVSPFLAILAIHLSKKQYQLLLAVLIFINVTVFGKFGTAMGVVNRGYSLQFFVLLFFTGGYIRLYNPFQNPCHCLVGLFFFTFLQLLVQLVHSLFHGFGSFNQVNFVYSGLVYFVGVFSFLWFKNTTFSSKFWILLVKVAPYTFAVYLFHDNAYVRNLLWHSSFQPVDYINSFWFIPLMLIVGTVVFLFGVFLDWIRSKIVLAIRGDKMLDVINSFLKMKGEKLLLIIK